MWTSLFKSGTVKENLVKFTRDGKVITYKVITGKVKKEADTWVVNEDKYGIYLIPETRGYTKFRAIKFWVSRLEMKKELPFLFSSNIQDFDLLFNRNIEAF